MNKRENERRGNNTKAQRKKKRLNEKKKHDKVLEGSKHYDKIRKITDRKRK